MSLKTWTIGLADNGHNYLAVATYIHKLEAWNVVLSVDGQYVQAVMTEDPCAVAHEMIAESQFEFS